MITLQGAIEKSLKFEWLDNTIIISYFGGSNNIFADCTYNIIHTFLIFKKGVCRDLISTCIKCCLDLFDEKLKYFVSILNIKFWHKLESFTFLHIKSFVSNQWFGFVTFYPADPDNLDPDPPENAMQLRFLNRNVWLTLLINEDFGIYQSCAIVQGKLFPSFWQIRNPALNVKEFGPKEKVFFLHRIKVNWEGVPFLLELIDN